MAGLLRKKVRTSSLDATPDLVYLDVISLATVSGAVIFGQLRRKSAI
jgi:hypothetical protein